MRYIGNKENIIEKIHNILKSHNVVGKSFFDFFSGTTNVARFYKELGYHVFASDVMFLSFCLQKAYIENNAEPTFEKLIPTLPYLNSATLFNSPLDVVVNYLNQIEPQQGFIYNNYTPAGTVYLPQPRMYFSNENGKIIDAIRLQIEHWKEQQLLTESEYYILLACLIETVSFYANVAGIYAAFHKKWDPRALKKMSLRTIKIYNNNQQNFVYNADSMTLLPEIDVDILYLDPPYNERQYLPNYHLVETIAKKIQISGRLFKSGRLSHDPNIGALSMIAAVLRKLGWTKAIEITMHGLEQRHVGNRNKFVQIANQLNIGLQGLKVPKATLPTDYWHYDTKGEKLGTIFIHIVVENFTESYSIFENHAGCEKGYFQTADGEHISLVKYTDREAYKAGDKNQIVFIPDLVLIDIKEKEAITIEGKKYEYRQNGINELAGYDAFDKMYLKKFYPKYKIVRTVVLYGSQEEKVVEVQVGFLLNENGKLVLGIKAPKLFKRAINNLLDFWR